MKNKIILILLVCFSINIYGQEIPFADIHAHVCLKPFHSRYTVNYNLWEKIEHNCQSENKAEWMIKGSTDVPKYSQSNLAACAKGNVKVIGLSMTPLEVQFSNIRILNEGKNGAGTLACMVGISLNDLDFLDKGDEYYFPIIRENIEFIKYGEKKPYTIDGKEYSYEIIKNKNQLQSIIDQENKLAIVLNIEGGHVLGRSLIKKDISKKEFYHKIVLDNVKRLKGSLPLYHWKDEYLEYPIFSLGINHFFYNGLGGQPSPFTPIQKFIFKAKKGIDAPISPLGKKVVQLMVNKNEGRRIIPDVKHMSVKSRLWYFDFLERKMIEGDTIPVLFSHAAVAGLSIEDPLFLKKDVPDKYKNSIFNHWMINL